MHTLPAWFRAFFDRRTPPVAKLAIIFAAIYGISPLDLIPDFIPVIGELDDITVIMLMILFFLRMTQTVRHDKTQVIDARIIPDEHEE